MNGTDGVKRTLTREGRSSGEAYVELYSAADMNKALDKDHELMGKRYIEVFSSSYKEMSYVLDRSCKQRETGKTIAGNDTIVRLRGLPYQCTKEEVGQFFTGLDIVANGIVLPMDANGRSTGESFVEFSTAGDATTALAKHKEKIGHRYIEIFKSTRRELREAQSMDRSARMRTSLGGIGYGRPGPYDRPPRGGGVGPRDRGFGMDRRRRGGFGAGGGGGGDFYRGEFFDEDQDMYGDDEFYEDDYEYEDEFARGGAGGGFRRRMPGAMGRGGYRGGDFYEDDHDGGWYGDDYGDDDDMQADYVVHMRGLPFKATDEDINTFFSPIVPVRIYREYGNDGRISGEANVEFASFQDAQAAMQKNRDLIQHRYIELFYRGSKSQGRGGGGVGGRGGGMPRGRGMGRSRPLMRDGGMGGGMPMGRPMWRGGAGGGRGRARGRGYRY